MNNNDWVKVQTQEVDEIVLYFFELNDGSFGLFEDNDLDKLAYTNQTFQSFFNIDDIEELLREDHLYLLSSSLG